MEIRHIASALGLVIGLLAATAALPAPGAAAPAGAAAALPSDSIYQLPVTLTDQAGRPFKLADRRGPPTIVSVFYSSCEFICPMLVEVIRATRQRLGDGERERIKVLLVTIDPARDTVAVLTKMAADRELDPAWTLARTDVADVRKLAAVLGVQYKALDNGGFNHSAPLILVDGDGRVVGRTTRINEVDPGFVKLVKTTLAAAGH